MDVPGYYLVYAWVSGSPSNMLPPIKSWRDSDDQKVVHCSDLYIAGLRAAYLTAKAVWGEGVPVVLDRGPRRGGHRPILFLNSGGKHQPRPLQRLET